MPRGTAHLKQWEANLVAEREAVQVTARCAFCPWELEGTVRETREAHAQHRARYHPDITPKPRRKRYRPYGQLQGSKSLDDNIANARTQGASMWAGSE